MTSAQSTGPAVARLTVREHQIVVRVHAGLPDKAIAASLGVSLHTVRSYLHRAAGKLCPAHEARRLAPRTVVMLYWRPASSE